MPFLYHPLIVHFPVALWLTSALLDLLLLTRGDRFYDRASRLLMGLGLLGAAPSIVSGFVDYVPLVNEGIGEAFVARHKVHMALAVGATAVYLVNFVWRWRNPQIGRVTLTALVVLGAILIAAAGYIGGEVRLVM